MNIAIKMMSHKIKVELEFTYACGEVLRPIIFKKKSISEISEHISEILKFRDKIRKNYEQEEA